MEQITALRAEWLAQLADAIEGAQRLAWQLGTKEHASSEARELYSRLEAARLELDSLRGFGGYRVKAPDFDWLQQLGWASPPADQPD
jgi:hypothetical protein